MKNLSTAAIPTPSRPSRRIPGMSQAQVAKAMGTSVAEVARLERIGLAKCRQGFEKHGLSLADFLDYFQSAKSHE